MHIKITNNDYSNQNSINICGKWIRYVRTGSYDKNHPKISQEVLIARLQTRGLMMNRSALSRIENGIRSLSDVEVLCFAEALHVPVTFLYKGVDSQMPKIEEIISIAAEDEEAEIDENNDNDDGFFLPPIKD